MKILLQCHARPFIALLMLGGMGILASLFPQPQLYAQQKKKDGGAVIGKIWEMTVRKADGKLKENPPLDLVNPKVRVRGLEIFGLGGKNIGSYKQPKPEQMIITFTDNQFKDYVVELSLALREPPTWRGFGKKEGSDDRLWFQFVFLKD